MQAARQKSLKKIKAEEAQKEKERLQKIINLNSFNSNPLDAIYQHVSNQIVSTITHSNKKKWENIN